MSTIIDVTEKKVNLDEFAEEFELPSKGLGITPEIPSKISIRPMKVMDEKLILTSNGDFNSLTTKLLNRCILTPNVDSAKLYDADRTYLIFMLRAISYGATYTIDIRCSSCGRVSSMNIDLFNDLKITKVESMSELYKTVTLPKSGYEITLKPLTGEDLEAIHTHGKGDIGNEYTETLVMRVKNIKGQDASYTLYKRLVENLIGIDSSKLRDAINNANFGMDMIVSKPCQACGEENQVQLQLSSDFFRAQ